MIERDRDDGACVQRQKEVQRGEPEPPLGVPLPPSWERPRLLASAFTTFTTDFLFSRSEGIEAGLRQGSRSVGGRQHHLKMKWGNPKPVRCCSKNKNKKNLLPHPVSVGMAIHKGRKGEGGR